MPLHDWSQVAAGLFHHFHQSWSIRITDALNAGLLPRGLAALVELFPPTVRDPDSLHKLIWAEIEDIPFQLPPGRQRLLVSYQAGSEKVAYIEPLGVGEVLPDMPLFLTSRLHIKIPLESTYQTTWNSLPEQLRIAVTKPN